MEFIKRFSLDETVLAPVDVQELFMNPRYFAWNKWYQPWLATERTESVARQIGNIAPEFNALGMDVAWIYYTDERYVKKPFKMAGRLYGVTPQPNDVLIPKTESSAFDEHETPFEKYLIDNNKKHILICGGYLTACVYWTAVHAALKGYKVTLLTDLSVDGCRRGELEKSHIQCLCDFKSNVEQSSETISSNIRYATADDILEQYSNKNAMMKTQLGFS